MTIYLNCDRYAPKSKSVNECYVKFVANVDIMCYLLTNNMSYVIIE